MTSARTEDAAIATGADLLVAALAAEGVTHVFGLPGTTIMEIIDSIARQSAVEYLSVRHEQAAAHMADGYFRVSRRLACCIASRGPGAANLAIGVHNAYVESIPLLAVVGQVADSIAYRDAFEEMDLLTFFAPMTKWRGELHVAERMPEFVAKAVAAATRGRTRPVLLSIPLDVAQRSVGPVPLPEPSRVGASVPAGAEVERAVEILVAAERPLIVAGGGIHRPWWDEGLVALAERLSAPVASTWLRKGVFPNAHPLFVGTLGYGASPVAQAALEDADVVVAAGCRFAEFTSTRWTLPRPETRVIQVDVDAEQIGGVHPVAIGLVGDAPLTVRLLADALEGVTSPLGEARVTRAARLRRDYEAAARIPAWDASSEGVASPALVEALGAALASHDALLFQDAHSFGPWIGRHLSFDRPGSYWAAAGGSMGWGFPAALGAQIALPDRRVIAVCGDASFWMVAQEFETAVRCSLPVVVVVANNFSYGNTRDRQRLAYDGRYLGVFHANPDFAEFARLLGGHGERVERAAELGPALERALASGLPAIVDVIQSRWEGLPSDLAPPVAR